MNLIIKSNALGSMCYLFKGENLISFVYNFTYNISLNNIYLAKVVEKKGNLSAYIVALDSINNALLEFTKTNNTLKIGDKILVQVTKEPTLPNKMAKVTGNITLFNSLVLYKPYATSTGIVSKATLPAEIHEKFNHLALKVSSLYNDTLTDILVAQVNNLVNIFSKITQITELGLVLAHKPYFNIIATNVNELTTIYVSENAVNLEIKTYLAQNNANMAHINVAPVSLKILKLIEYNVNELSDTKIIINDEINLVFYITEAFNYIDVNFSGNHDLHSSKEENLYYINNDILDICASQINARNLSGQIIIDLLKLVNKDYKNKLVHKAKAIFKNSGKNVSVLGFSNLGLLEISKQKHQENLYVLLKSISYNAWHLLELLTQSNSTTLEVMLNDNIQTYLKKYASEALKELGVYKEIIFKIDNNITFKLSEKQ